MTSELSLLLKKYSIPALLLIAGVFMLIIGFTGNQNGVFMVAAILMLAAAAISILYSSGNLKPKLLIAIGLLAGAGAIVTLVISSTSVYNTATYNDNYDFCKLMSKQNLEDIRYIQKVHAEQNGTYLSDWDAFIEFAKNAEVDIVEAQGVVPSRAIDMDENNYLYTGNPPIDRDMNEEEAYRLSLWLEGPNYSDFSNFKRDTVSQSLIEFKFGNDSYTENREKLEFYAFSVDSLPIIPFTTERWNLETLDSLNINDLVQPAIKVSGMIPFAEQEGKNDDQEEMFFGSITTHSVDGSWELD
ncbi:MAG: hypothetical protein QNK23_12015 [Crocinitomicaceae bacterium]|nr:hypothetical protein [Crocinitomicaceae bacterium]